MSFARIGWLALFAAACFGQKAAPEFEVASIKPSGSLQENVHVGIHIDGAQFHAAQMSLLDYTDIAYKVKYYQVDGPAWMAGVRFDIDATIPDGASRDDVPDMLRQLLETRFGLKAHRGTKDLPIYAMVVAPDGIKMKATPADDAQFAPCKNVDVKVQGGRGGVNADYGCGTSFSFGDNKLTGNKLSMPMFADMLARFTDRPVQDMTKLPDRYDFTLDLSQEDYMAMLIRSAVVAGVNLPPQALAMMNGSDDSLMMALRRLGLKLEPRKAPFEVIVVDDIRKEPSAN